MMHKRTPSTKRIMEALTTSHGRVAEAAQLLRVEYKILRSCLMEDRDLRIHLKGIRELSIDKAEAKLMEAVEKGEQWAIRFLLTGIGKKRGWGENPIPTHLDNIFGEQYD